MNADGESLEDAMVDVLSRMRQAREAYAPALDLREVGSVLSVSTGIAEVSGLPGVGYDELLRFAGGAQGIAFNVDEDSVGVILLDDSWKLEAGDQVERTGRVMDIAVGDALLGRVIDPLGNPLDDLGPIDTHERRPIERAAAPIMDRAAVAVPLQTGIKAIDALIPIGRGQRELILGDRQTGKTALAIDTILNQRGQDVLCVYCAIGQRASAVAKAIATLRDQGALAWTVVVVAGGDRPAGLSYIAPYAAMSVAEHFMEAGRDVLIVLDDLTQHARAYRELSLLLRRPPGREAFPGDIFYLHSRLLERATHLRAERGGGSLTALPIVETEAQDMSAYIPTNLISITDGQVVLSRVGGKAQRPAFRALAGDLKLVYAQFEELETFSRFGARLDDASRRSIEHGRRLRACLQQPESRPVAVAEQLLLLQALAAGLLDEVALNRIGDAESSLQALAARLPAPLRSRLHEATPLAGDEAAQLVAFARAALAPLRTQAADTSKP